MRSKTHQKAPGNANFGRWHTVSKDSHWSIFAASQRIWDALSSRKPKPGEIFVTHILTKRQMPDKLLGSVHRLSAFYVDACDLSSASKTLPLKTLLFQMFQRQRRDLSTLEMGSCVVPSRQKLRTFHFISFFCHAFKAFGMCDLHSVLWLDYRGMNRVTISQLAVSALLQVSDLPTSIFKPHFKGDNFSTKCCQEQFHSCLREPVKN